MRIPEKSENVHRVCQIADDVIGINNIRYIFEFGSRYGEDTVQFAEKYPDATIFSFECNKNTIDHCIKKFAEGEYKNIIFSQCAIAETVGEKSFYPIDKEKTRTTWEDGNQGASSLFKASGKYPVENYVQTTTIVKTTTLKAVMNEYKIPRIDIMWMDVQGAELMALSGLEERLSDVLMIFTEVEFFEIYNNQPLFHDVKKKLEDNNFIFCGFMSCCTYFGDALFINSRYIQESNLSVYGLSKSMPTTEMNIRSVVRRKFAHVAKSLHSLFFGKTR